MLKMKSRVILWLLLTITACSEAVVMNCIEGTPPFKSTRNIRGSRAYDLLFIPAFKFACYGRVTQWGVFMRPHETTLDAHVGYSIDFQVWRPERSGIEVLNCYHFVGSNFFPVFHTESTGRFVGDVPENQLIEVQPFDIIGVSVSDSMQYYTQNAQHMWYSLTELTLVPSVTTACLENPPDPGSNLRATNTWRPLITAVVDTTNTSQAPRPIEPPTNPAEVNTDTLHLLSTNPITMDTSPPRQSNPVTVDITHSAPSNPVTMDTSHSAPSNTVTVDTVPSNLRTDTEYPSTINTTAGPTSRLGTEGVIGISVSVVGLFLLTLIVLLVIVPVCFMWRRKVLNRQVGVGRAIPPNPPNSIQKRQTGVVKTDKLNEVTDHRKEQLYTQMNLAYNAQEFPGVINPVDHINEEDDGYERIRTLTPGPYMETLWTPTIANSL